MPLTAAIAEPFVKLSDVPTMYTKTGYVPVAVGSWPLMLNVVLHVEALLPCPV